MPDLDRDAPPLVNPNDIARHTFEVARRGYEQQQVRAYLHELATRIDQLQRTEHELRDQLRRLEEKQPAARSSEPDDTELLERLGEETTRVLTSAREAATEIRGKAEASAERIVEDAIAQATRTRADATTEVERRLHEARTEADRLLEAARNELEVRTAEAEAAAAVIREQVEADTQVAREEAQGIVAAARQEAEEIVEAARLEGRDMVQEAQTVRERVLRDLSTKRKKARHQIEQLNAGRERLLEAYAVVRSTVDTATLELEESVLDAKRAADEAARRVDLEPEEDLASLDAEVSGADLGGLPIVVSRMSTPARVDEPFDDPTPSGPTPAVTDPPAPIVSGGGPEVPVSDAVPPAPTSGPALGDDFAPIDLPGAPKRSEVRTVRTPPTLDPIPSTPGPALSVVPDPDPPPPAPATAPVAPSATEPEPAPEVAPEPVAEVEVPAEVAPVAPAAPAATTEPPKGKAKKAKAASAVFARLHEAADQPIAAATEEPSPEPSPSTEQAEHADEHVATADELAFEHRAEVLGPIEADLLRRLKRALADEQNEVLDLLRRLQPAGVADLLPAVEDHAARWTDVAAPGLAAAAAAGAAFAGGKAGSTKDLAKDLAASLTGPLRDRIDRSFEAADGDLDTVAERVRALYREWKNQRLPELGPSLVVAAYGRGMFDAANKGAKVRWAVDPSRPPCPDCDDNVLAGVVVKGEEFPTGNACAPAHPGCHCLVLVHEDVLLTD